MPGFRQTIALLALLALSGCGAREVAMGAGTLAGMGAMQERGLGGAIDDYSLKVAINELWFRTSIALYEKADLMISEGRVLLIGRVPDEITRLQAELLAHQAGAKEVVNRLTVGEPLSFERGVTDRWIGAKLLAETTFDRDVAALNYDIEVVNGVVYLMGIAQNESEVRRVSYLASQIDGVLKVESYVRVPTLVLLPEGSFGSRGAGL